MDLKLSAAEEAFREEVRAYFRECIPADMATRTRRGLPESAAAVTCPRRSGKKTRGGAG